MYPITRLITVCSFAAITASCGVVDNGWDYSNTTDPVTKNSTHSASRLFNPEGSDSAKASIEASIECLKENDPYSLYVNFLSFDGDSTKAESALELSNDINIRFNGVAIGPLTKEGSEFSNEARYQLARLNVIPIFDIYKETKSSGDNALGALGIVVRMFPNATASERLLAYDKVIQATNVFGGTTQATTPGLYDLQRKIWETDFVFSAATSVGNLSISFPLTDPAVKKVIEICGFTFTEKPSINPQRQTERPSDFGAEEADGAPPSAAAPPEAAVVPIEEHSFPADEAAVVPPEEHSFPVDDAAVAPPEAVPSE
jgi:hypothetical protein